MNACQPEKGAHGDSWTLVPVELEDGSAPFETFLRKLHPYARAVAMTAVEEILAREGTNICNSEWGAHLKKGLYEFRVRRTLNTICRETGVAPPEGLAPDEPVLLRIFFGTEAGKVLLLTGGYDKGRDPSRKRQQREIDRARRVLETHRREATQKTRKR